MRRWVIFIYLINIICYQSAFGRSDSIPGSRWDDVRNHAMGDSAMPLADDGASALFQNPAHIAAFSGAHFEPLNFSLYANQIYFDTADLNFFKAINLSSFSSTLSSNPGQQTGLGFHFLPNFFMKYFAFGLLIQNSLNSYADSGGNIFSYAKYEVIPAAGVAIPLARGIVRLGYSFHWVNETSGRASGTDGFTNGIQQGSGFSHNAGFALVLPVKYNPSFDIVARNIGGVNYSSTVLYRFSSNPSGVPETDPMSIDASFSFSPKIGRGGKTHFVFQLRDILNSSQFSILRRASFGTEVNFAKTLYFRLGLNGLYYPSIGIGFKQEKTNFGFAWYSQEIGGPDGPNRDIQFKLQFQLKAF